MQEPGSNVRSRPLVHRADLVKGQFQIDRKKYKVVPVRFVQACTRGHVSDINWHVYVHGKEDKCRRNLWLDERGTSGELTDMTVRCDCGKFKELSAATKLNDVPLGFCNGPRPWLGELRQRIVRQGRREGADQSPADSVRVELLLCSDALGHLNS